MAKNATKEKDTAKTVETEKVVADMVQNVLDNAPAAAAPARTLEVIKGELDAQVRKYNSARLNMDMAAMQKADEECEKLVTEYAGKAKTECFIRLMNTSNPIYEALKELTFASITVKDERGEDKNDVTRGITDKSVQIDILKLDDFVYGKNKIGIAAKRGWQYTVQRFNQLLCVRAATELGITADGLKQISDSYFIADKAKDIKLGKTPASNNAILTMLQQCIDEIIFLDDGKGKNTYKATSHDVNYLVMTYTKKGKTALSVATANHTTMRTLITSICHRIITGGLYGVEYKKK